MNWWGDTDRAHRARTRGRDRGSRGASDRHRADPPTTAFVGRQVSCPDDGTVLASVAQLPDPSDHSGRRDYLFMYLPAGRRFLEPIDELVATWDSSVAATHAQSHHDDPHASRGVTVVCPRCWSETLVEISLRDGTVIPVVADPVAGAEQAGPAGRHVLR